jgi:hypothetical protein
MPTRVGIIDGVVICMLAYNNLANQDTPRKRGYAFWCIIPFG